MGLNSIGKLFMPKNKIFYNLFEEVAETVRIMGAVLKQLVNETDVDKRASLTTQLEDLEHLNDDHTHKIFTELGRNFITPFDREDIHYLASALDDIADYIYSSAKKIMFYRVNPNDPGIQKMVELIEQGTVFVQSAVAELRDMKNLRKITEALVRVNDIENQADDIFDLASKNFLTRKMILKKSLKKEKYIRC